MDRRAFIQLLSIIPGAGLISGAFAEPVKSAPITTAESVIKEDSILPPIVGAGYKFDGRAYLFENLGNQSIYTCDASLLSCTLPSLTFEEIEIPSWYYGIKMYHKMAGKHHWQPITLSWLDSVVPQNFKNLIQKQVTIQHEIEITDIPVELHNYKFNMLTVLNNQQMELMGCFIKDLVWENSYSDEGSTVATIVFDYARIT
jgi:hypothetical protein